MRRSARPAGRSVGPGLRLRRPRRSGHRRRRRRLAPPSGPPRVDGDRARSGSSPAPAPAGASRAPAHAPRPRACPRPGSPAPPRAGLSTGRCPAVTPSWDLRLSQVSRNSGRTEKASRPPSCGIRTGADEPMGAEGRDPSDPRRPFAPRPPRRFAPGLLGPPVGHHLMLEHKVCLTNNLPVVGGECGPPWGQRGRKSPRQGCLGRRAGPWTWLCPRSQPLRSPSVHQGWEPRGRKAESGRPDDRTTGRPDDRTTPQSTAFA